MKNILSKLFLLLKKYFPDILFLGGLFWYLLQEYVGKTADWEFVNGKFQETGLPQAYEWNKIIPIMIMFLGLDILIRRLLFLRKQRSLENNVNIKK